MNDTLPTEAFALGQFQDLLGNDVGTYEKSWTHEGLEQERQLAHDLMSGTVSILQGDVLVQELDNGCTNHIVSPEGYDDLRCILMFEDQRLVRVLIAHDACPAPVIEIPPPIAINVQLSEQ